MATFTNTHVNVAYIYTIPRAMARKYVQLLNTLNTEKLILKLRCGAHSRITSMHVRFSSYDQRMTHIETRRKTVLLQGLKDVLRVFPAKTNILTFL